MEKGPFVKKIEKSPLIRPTNGIYRACNDGIVHILPFVVGKIHDDGVSVIIEFKDISGYRHTGTTPDTGIRNNRFSFEGSGNFCHFCGINLCHMVFVWEIIKNEKRLFVCILYGFR